jgi:hypothetical protein
MRMMLFAGVVAALSMPAIAVAGEFEEIAADAIRVDRDGLGGILWAKTASCSDGDDLAKRQCRAIRAALMSKYDGQMLVVPGDAAAFQVAAFDDKKKAAPVLLTGCIACVDPLLVDGVPVYVTSDKGATGWSGSIAKAGKIHETARQFKTDEEAIKWKTSVAPRLKTEFLVQIPKNAALWKDGGKSGFSLTVLGFRVYDPCDGGIICASPKSGKASVDKVACGGAVVEGTPDPDVEVKPKKEVVPDELSATQIKTSMAPVRVAATACFDKYGVEGNAKLHVTVGSDGAVVAIDQTGDFDGTPTGTCIEEAVKTVTFPKTKKARQSFKYPISLH